MLAIIPARGGSKGVPNKNLVVLGGKPLIQWTIEAALQSKCFQRVVISTDSVEIATVASAMGAAAPFLRPSQLAQDESPTLPVVLHAIEQLGISHGAVALLQPTSPLRTSADIRSACGLHASTGRSVVSVTEAKPWLFVVHEDGSLAALTDPAPRRQDAPVVAPNGAIYIADMADLMAGRSWWDGAVAFHMPAERSVDIDTLADLDLAGMYLNQRGVAHG